MSVDWCATCSGTGEINRPPGGGVGASCPDCTTGLPHGLKERPRRVESTEMQGLLRWLDANTDAKIEIGWDVSMVRAGVSVGGLDFRGFARTADEAVDRVADRLRQSYKDQHRAAWGNMQQAGANLALLGEDAW